jgi:hypothetical protein
MGSTVLLVCSLLVGRSSVPVPLDAVLEVTLHVGGDGNACMIEYQ